MAIVVNANLRNVNAANNNFIEVCVPLSFSGNYSTNGDGLNIASVIQDLPTQEVVSMFCEGNSSTNTSLTNAGGFYAVVGQPGPFGGTNPTNGVASTAPASWKLKVFKNTAGSVAEYSAGAYGADVTSDYVMLYLKLRKLGAF